jgi:hypothetical protein
MASRRQQYEDQDAAVDHEALAYDILDTLSDDSFPLLTRARRGIAVSALSDAMHDVKLVKQLAFQGVILRVMSLLERHSGKLEPTRLGELGSVLLKLTQWESDIVRAKVLLEADLPLLVVTQLEHAVQNLTHYGVDDADDQRACEWADLIAVWQSLLQSLLRAKITVSRLSDVDLSRLLGVLSHVHEQVTERYYLRRNDQDLLFVRTLSLAHEHDAFCGVVQAGEALSLVATILARSDRIEIASSALRVLAFLVLPLEQSESVITKQTSSKMATADLFDVTLAVQASIVKFLAPGLGCALMEPDSISEETPEQEATKREGVSQ